MKNKFTGAITSSLNKVDGGVLKEKIHDLPGKNWVREIQGLSKELNLKGSKIIEDIRAFLGKTINERELIEELKENALYYEKYHNLHKKDVYREAKEVAEELVLYIERVSSNIKSVTGERILNALCANPGIEDRFTGKLSDEFAKEFLGANPSGEQEILPSEALPKEVETPSKGEEKDSEQDIRNEAVLGVKDKTTQVNIVREKMDFGTSVVSQEIQDGIQEYVNEKKSKDLKKAGMGPDEFSSIYECINNNTPIPEKQKQELERLFKIFSSSYPDFFSIKQINGYYQKLEEQARHQYKKKKVTHIPKEENKSESIYVSTALPTADRLAIIDIVEFQIGDTQEKTLAEKKLLLKILHGTPLDEVDLAIVQKYLEAFSKYAIQKNKIKTHIQEKTYEDLIDFLNSTDKKGSYVKAALRNEILTIIRIQNQKKWLPKQIERKREIQQSNIEEASRVLIDIRANTAKLGSIYQDEKQLRDKELHEHLKNKSTEQKVLFIFSLLEKVYRSPSCEVIKNTFLDMTTIDDLGIWLGALLFYIKGLSGGNPAEKNSALLLISKLGPQEANYLLTDENLKGKEKELITQLKPILEPISLGQSLSPSTVFQIINKIYKEEKMQNIIKYFVFQKGVMYEEWDFVDSIKNKLNTGLDSFKTAFSDYIEEKCESNKSIEDGVRETVYFMSFIHNTPDVKNLFTTLGLMKDLFKILDETSFPILIGMMAYYNQTVLGGNNGRIITLYYLFQNMERSKLKNLIASIETIVPDKEYTADLKSSMCRMMLDFAFKTHKMTWLECSIDPNWMQDSRIMHDGSDYMDQLDWEDDQTVESDLRNSINPDQYIKRIVDRQRERGEMFPEDIFTGFDDVFDLIEIIWSVDQNIYYNIIEELLDAQQYTIESTNKGDLIIRLTNASKFKELIKQLTKDCPLPKELRLAADVSLKIDNANIKSEPMETHRGSGKIPVHNLPESAKEGNDEDIMLLSSFLTEFSDIKEGDFDSTGLFDTNSEDDISLETSDEDTIGGSNLDEESDIYLLNPEE